MQIQGSYVPAGASKYASSAAEEKVAIKASPGLLFEMTISNVTTNDRYVWLFDSLSAAGAVAIPPIKVPAGATLSLEGMAEPFSTGLYVASSTTHSTYTASGTADLIMTARYK
jgi:hypothetical protein